MSSAEDLNTISSQMTLSISITCIVLGILGHILNIIILSRRSLRSNPCAIYFLAATCANIFVVVIIFPFRILVGTFNIDPTVYNEPLCKIQVCVFSIVRALGLWFIALACIDRFCCSSSTTKLRSLSSMKIAQRSIVSCSIVMCIVYIHYLIYYEIGLAPDRFGRLSPTCVAQRGFYRTFAPLWNMIWYAALPSLIMFIFGLLTIANIRQSHRHVTSHNQSNSISMRRNGVNNQLVKMLLVQVITILLTIAPFFAYRIRASFVTNPMRNEYQLAQENLFLQVATVVSLISPSISFYLFTLSGTIFRRELLRLLSNCLQIPLHTLQLQTDSLILTNTRNTAAQRPMYFQRVNPPLL